MTAIFGFAWIRLMSYGGLGKNFTFTLAVPKKLITTGIYSWVQHPSYVGLLGVTMAIVLFVARVDGVAVCISCRILCHWCADGSDQGCFMPRKLIEVPYVSEVVAAVMVSAVGFALSLRILDEEEMMRNEFGDEWEKWHKKTARLIPGIF